MAEEINDEDQWQIEGDARTLKEAELIKNDPERSKKALDFMEKEMKAMSKSLEELARERFPETYKKEEK